LAFLFSVAPFAPLPSGSTKPTSQRAQSNDDEELMMLMNIVLLLYNKG
jgi:hypothetical protein